MIDKPSLRIKWDKIHRVRGLRDIQTTLDTVAIEFGWGVTNGAEAAHDQSILRISR